MTTATSLGLSDHQYANAQGIIAAVKKRGWSSRAAVIAVETALTESGMRILASANVPLSKQYPHDLLSWTSDGLGHDHASCGMFQQQTGYAWALPGTSTMGTPNGWGTPAELMNAEISTEKFLNALSHVSWNSMSRWEAAQAVQHSAFADGRNYRAQDNRALQIVAAMWGLTGAPKPPTTKPTPTPTPTPTGTQRYEVRPGDSLSKIAAQYKTTWQHLQTLNHLADPNKIYIGQWLLVPKLSGTKPSAPSKPVSTGVRIVGTYTVKKNDTLTAICRRYPQSWITVSSVARINGISNPDHIVIDQVLRIGG